MKTGQRRMVHISIWASGQVAKISRTARLLYIGMITLGDDDGRLKGSPALLRSQIFPYDDDISVADVVKLLAEIEGSNLVVRYEVDGEAYYFHPKWEDYQLLREDRRRESNIPAPDIEFLPLTTVRQPSGTQLVDKRRPKLSKDKLSKDNLTDTVAENAFVIFWEKYPKKVGKKTAWKAWMKIKLDPLLTTRIMASLDSAVTSEQWQKDKGRYIPHAATWLNGERWEDELTPGKQKNNKYDHVGHSTTSA